MKADGGCDTHVEAVGSRGHRNPHELIAASDRLRAESVEFTTHDQSHPLRWLRLIEWNGLGVDRGPDNAYATSLEFLECPRPVGRPVVGDAKRMTDRDSQALPIERIVAIGAQDHAVHAERRRIPEEQSDVVDVVDAVADQDRCGLIGFGKHRVQGLGIRIRSVSAGQHSPVDVESSDRFDQPPLCHQDRGVR